jgi:hypothetical protein
MVWIQFVICAVLLIFGYAGSIVRGLPGGSVTMTELRGC